VSDCVICLVKPPRKTTARRRCCEVCQHELATLLDELNDRLPLLPDMLVPSGVPSSIRLARDASPAPLRVDVLALLDDRGDLSVLGVLAPYADILATERRLSGQVDPIRSLRAHLEWVAAADWLEDFTKTLRRIGGEVRRVLGEEAKAVATCHREVATRVTVVAGERIELPVECRGVITASVYSDTATCVRCGDPWPRSRWQMLGRLQETSA
jgi:hypothetical protein